jgi:hypothetical protein
MLARLDGELTGGSEDRFAFAQGVFVELGNTQIAMNGRDVAEAKSGQVACETFGWSGYGQNWSTPRFTKARGWTLAPGGGHACRE